MSHFLDYMDELYKKEMDNINEKYPHYIIDEKFTVYREIKPIAEEITFKTIFKLRKRHTHKNITRTTVLFEHNFDNRKAIQYFSEYDIINTLIYLYDNFKVEGDHIYSQMCNLIKDNGCDISFMVNDKVYTFNGIEYQSQNRLFLTLADYELGINDFIGLLNLVIEKDRYSPKSEKGKGTIVKYIFFILLFSKRISTSIKSEVQNIFKNEKLYKGNKLITYKKTINKIRGDKLYFKSSLFNDKFMLL